MADSNSNNTGARRITLMTQVTPDAINQTRSSMALADALSLLRNRRSNATDVAKALKFDPNLSKQILVEVNSPFYALRNQVSSLEQAIALLGFRRIQELLSRTTSHEMYNTVENSYFEMTSFKKHGLAVGCLSEEIAKRLGLPQTEEFFKAGTMHDIGKYLYLAKLSKEFEKIVKEARLNGIPLYKLEREKLGFDHCDLGVIMADSWDLSDTIKAAIRYHHTITDRQLAALTTREGLVVEVVTYANLLAHGTEIGSGQRTRPDFTSLPKPPGLLSQQDVNDITETAESEYLEQVKIQGLENN